MPAWRIETSVTTARRTFGLGVVVLVFFVLVDVLAVLVDQVVRRFPAAASEFPLQCGEVCVRGMIFQLPGHPRLLGLSTAAPHGSTPSHEITGQPLPASPTRQASLVALTVHVVATFRHLTPPRRSGG